VSSPASLISAARARVWACVIAAALGIYAASLAAWPSPFWFAAMVAACGLAAALGARRGWILGILLGIFTAAGGWYTLNIHEYPARTALATLTPGTETLPQQAESTSDASPSLSRPSSPLIHARIRFLETPREVQPATGLLSKFTMRQPGVRALATLLELETSPGTFQPARGNVIVSITQHNTTDTPKDWELGSGAPIAGRTAQVLGLFTPLSPPTNPGEPDRRPPSLDRCTIGIINCSSWDVITLLPSPRDTAYFYYNLKQRLRDRAGAIVSSAATSQSGESSSGGTSGAAQPSVNRALLLALLLGEQDPLLRDTYDLFARAGLVHILSISGFHLGLMAWLALLALRLTGDRGWLEPVCVGLLVILYSLILPPQSPLLRSAAMVLTLLAVQATGRRYDHVTLLGWITIGLLVWRPTELWSLGFSLSVGLTALLFWLADDFTYVFTRPPLRGTIRFRERPPLDRARHALFASVSSNILCWVTSLPILISLIGIISPSGIMLSILLTPLFIAVLALGYAALLMGLVLGWLLPGIESLASGLINGLLTFSIHIVTFTDTLPLAYLRIPPTPLLWGIITTLALLIWARALGRSRAGHGGVPHVTLHPANTKAGPQPTIGVITGQTTASVTLSARCAAITHHALHSPWPSAFAALLLFLCLPIYWHTSQRLAPSTLIRIDMLDVGNGTCIILRAPDERGNTQTLMWDCGTLGGTSGGPHNAARTIIRAARELNITTIPTVIISHPDLDHFGALPQLLEPLGVRNVIIPHRFTAQASEQPGGAPALLLSHLRDSTITLQNAAAGDVIMFGGITLTFLSPPPVAPFTQDNDHSLVAAVTHPTLSTPLMLLTGDVDREAITYIRANHPEQAIAPLVLELPHHGAARAPAIDWVTLLKPRVVLQSTGRSRAGDPRWSPVTPDAWYCTALDGAAHITIHTDHTLTTSSHLRGELSR
jgi:ComEC/Rec2-related protein